jgi:hypothetical protein
MNELKEELDNFFKENIHSVGDGWWHPYNSYSEIRNDLMQLIETYTAKKELEARLDEWNLASEYRHSANIKEELYFNNGMIERLNQLSSQLTNNKEGIENE